MHIPQPLTKLRVEHGEGPVWDAEGQNLYWVDINQGKYVRLHLPDGQLRVYEVGQPLGVLALRQAGGLVMGLRDGFAFWDEENQHLHLLGGPEQDDARVRFNDGAVDPQGRFWAGTMEWEGKAPLGKLFCLQADGNWHQMEDGLWISNGMAWSTDQSTFFFIDTLQHAVFAYDYEPASGRISNKRVHLSFSSDEYPDGMAMDGEGGFWIALYGSGKLARFDAEGKRLPDINLPVAYPTSCCFGGPEMNTLFITTSHIQLSPEEKAAQPLAGCTFYLHTEVQGMPQRRFGG